MYVRLSLLPPTPQFPSSAFPPSQFTIDDSLPFQLNIFLAQVFSLLGTLAVVCYGLPWVTLLLVPLAMIYHKIQHYYRRTSRWAWQGGGRGQLVHIDPPCGCDVDCNHMFSFPLES